MWCLLLPVWPAGQRNLYFSLPAIVGWLGTAFFHAALIVVMVLVGAGSLDSDSASGHTWSLLRNGLLMFTIVIITVHLQLAIVIDQWIWLHHLAIWGSIGKLNVHRQARTLPAGLLSKQLPACLPGPALCWTGHTLCASTPLLLLPSTSDPSTHPVTSAAFCCVRPLLAVLWFLFLLAFGAFPIRLSTDLHFSLETVARYPQFWLQIFMVPIACLLPVFFFRAMKR